MDTARCGGTCRSEEGETRMTTVRGKTDVPITGSELFIHNIDSAPAYWWLDDLWIVLAESKDTGGRFSMMMELLPKGSGPGPHKHTRSE
jgi:hypothetical protein